MPSLGSKVHLGQSSEGRAVRDLQTGCFLIRNDYCISVTATYEGQPYGGDALKKIDGVENSPNSVEFFKTFVSNASDFCHVEVNNSESQAGMHISLDHDFLKNG